MTNYYENQPRWGQEFNFIREVRP